MNLFMLWIVSKAQTPDADINHEAAPRKQHGANTAAATPHSLLPAGEWQGHGRDFHSTSLNHLQSVMPSPSVYTVTSTFCRTIGLDVCILHRVSQWAPFQFEGEGGGE